MYESIPHTCVVIAVDEIKSSFMARTIFPAFLTGLIMLTATNVGLGQDKSQEHSSSPQASASTSQTISISDKGTQKWRTSTLLTDFNIELRGKIELTDDDKDVKSLSDDGYLEIEKTAFGSRRTIVIESLGGGKMKKEYYEGRTKMDWETNGKAWLAEILPGLVRSSTIGAEGRVDRFFRKGGAPAVLAEFENLEGDYTKAHYGKLLLAKNIPATEIPKVITTLAESISSDYYLSSLLKDSMEKLLVSKEAGDAFFKASEKIESDYYKSVVLKEALQKYSASPEQVKSILKSATSIESAYYLAVVLNSLLDETNVKEESMAELMQVSKKINSDYYRADVLSKAIQKKNISKSAMKTAVEAVAEVNSDYYKSNVFNAMAENTQMDNDIQLQVINLIGTSVESDYYAAVSLNKMLRNQKFTDNTISQLLAVAGKINSAYYASDVLQNAAKLDLTNGQVLAYLKATENISSDHYLTNALASIAPKVKTGDQSAKDAYRQAARKIGSETYYGRALRNIE
jgi:hypothetical protein